MFRLSRIRDRVEVPPKLLAKEYPNAVKAALNKKYSWKVVLHVGYAIGVFDLIEISQPLVDKGVLYQDVVFRLVVFRPVDGSVLTGRIISHDAAFGIRVSLGFFSNVFIPSGNLLMGSRYNVGKKIWEYCDDDSQTATDDDALPYEVDHTIFFRVQRIQFFDHFDKRPEPLNPELIRLQLMPPNERLRNQEELQAQRLTRLSREAESEVNSRPPMYVVGTLKRSSQDGDASVSVLGLREWLTGEPESGIDEERQKRLAREASEAQERRARWQRMRGRGRGRGRGRRGRGRGRGGRRRK